MKRQGLWWLMAVSVAFNCFFVIGYVRGGSALTKRPTFEQRARSFVGSLDLDTHQREVFEQLLSETVQERKKMRKQDEPRRSAFWAELVKDHPDPQILMRHTSSDARQAKRRLMVQQMTKFMAVLRPDQRKAFVEAMRARRARR